MFILIMTNISRREYWIILCRKLHGTINNVFNICINWQLNNSAYRELCHLYHSTSNTQLNYTVNFTFIHTRASTVTLQHCQHKILEEIKSQGKYERKTCNYFTRKLLRPMVAVLCAEIFYLVNGSLHFLKIY